VDRLKRFLPFLEWFEGYSLTDLRIDFISGLTVALVLVPQSMAYAQLAGLPAYYGLYAAFLPPMVANLFGSSRQLATGPVAVVSLMTAASLEPLATAGSEQYIAYAILLALMVGLFQFALGVLRLGLIVNLLSHPVVNGFTNAAALIIATSQLSKVFGVSVDKAEHHYETIWRVLETAVHSTHLPTLGMAVIAFGTMIGLRRVNPRLPNVLIAVVITTVLSWAFGFQKNETVPVEVVQSEHVAELVHDFNRTVTERQRLEALRAEGSKMVDGLATGDGELCTSCHAQREIDQFESGLTEEGEGAEQRALALHQMAGLVNVHISALKERTSELRTELREIKLRRIEEPDGTPRFVPVGEDVTEGEPGWHIRVGGAQLNPEELLIEGGGRVVGVIPQGLPAMRVPTIDLAIIPKLIAAAIIISILGFMEAISIAKAMAAKTRQRLDPNQELIGQGLANIVGCMAQSYAVSGSFSRSAVNLQAGAKTGLSNVFSSGVVAVVLLFFSPLLYHLPQAVLAAIIMMAVVGLLNVSGFVHSWRTSPFDGFVSVLAFAVTLMLAPHLEWGLFLGVALSLGGYIFRTMRPKVAHLSPHPDGALRDADRYDLAKCRHIAMVRFDGPLNFASTSYLEDEILARVAELPELRQLVVVGNGITEIDASGEEMLRHIVERLRTVGYKVSFSGLTDAVIDVLRRSQLYQRIGEEHFYPTQAQAIAAVYAASHPEPEPDCPFRTVMPRVVELSLHPDGTLRSADRHDLPVCKHIAVFRFDDPLTYANTEFLEEEIRQLLEGRDEVRHVMFVAHGVTDIDPSGARKLCNLVERLREDGFEVSFSGFRDEVLEVLDRIDTDQVIGSHHRYATEYVAIAGLYASAHTESDEAVCPFLPLAPRLTELSLHPDGSLREARRHGLKLCRHIAALRIDGPFVLANPDALEAEFIRWVKSRLEVTHLLLVAHTLDKLSEGEAEKLFVVVERLREAGYEVAFCSFRDHVFETLGRTGVADRIGLDKIYPNQVLAVAGLWGVAHDSKGEPGCPFRQLLPNVVEVSLHPDGSLRNAERYDLAACRHIAALRIDGTLNFASVGFVIHEIERRVGERPDLSHVLIANDGLGSIDEAACEEMSDLVVRLRERGLQVVVSGLKDEVRDVLERTGCLDVVGQDSLFPTRARAVAAIHQAAHAGSDESPCPLVEVVKLEAGADGS
jgi:MFS superfamily sulfate permease-like transporter